MKKIFLQMIIATMFSLNVISQNSTTDPGVVINEVKWATRNVDKPGTFTGKPEDAGMFYQWNRKVAWPATGSVRNWYNNSPTDTAWEKNNDPSPTGWRVPTLNEIKTLFDTDKVRSEWLTVNGVNGRKFTDKATGNSIFLPATGQRRGSDGRLDDIGSCGSYWSSTKNPIGSFSTQNGGYRAYGFGFGEGFADWSDGDCRNGISVRSVTTRN